MVPVYLCRMFYNNNKKFGHTWRFQEWVDGLNRKCHFAILRDKLGWTSPLNQSVEGFNELTDSCFNNLNNGSCQVSMFVAQACSEK